MATRPELLPGGVLFETRRLYTETINNVLDRMHFIFNSQQHTIAAQKVKILMDSIPSLSMSPDKHRAVSPDNHRAVSPDKHRAVSPDKHRAVSFVG